jgi:hypothetical protein
MRNDLIARTLIDGLRKARRDVRVATSADPIEIEGRRREAEATSSLNPSQPHLSAMVLATSVISLKMRHRRVSLNRRYF